MQTAPEETEALDFVAADEDAGSRLDVAIAAQGVCTRSAAQNWIRDGRVTVDEKPAKSASMKLRAGQHVVMTPPEARPLEVQIEYEVGEVRTGVTNDEQLTRLVAAIQACRHVVLKGIFSHEGHTYKAASIADCCEKAQAAYAKTVRAAEIIRGMGVELDTVSVGATPSGMHMQSFPGITELRLGTYIFFDVGQSNAIGDFSRCAATVLASVISKPQGDRVVLDTGAKALVSQNRPTGICATAGFGAIKGAESITIDALFDEHGVLNSPKFREQVAVGDKVEVIPSHVCPTVNLYDTAYLVSDGKVIRTLPIECRGHSK